ncbi:fungal specific transcription factor domain-containing protein [Aspergillus ibericus CBS 121593]|uniref:Xylanolytic transcriptional activator regulatory domain-containing protein n=1 Tax=Aspergillus ibericus CBS 121593 TaxID=1448316 RepID=A0A395GSZ3_9EURO|nr:hypothetical protein BO80DRAFT_437184 [Aspergillus ibericus CBS 121593]RAK98078.1 hypothetical protein BO80DRAFT_437184 [Aspergillus ibericus CBS 121593]
MSASPSEQLQMEVVHPMINATESYSPSHSLRLFYDSCSNFSFLQHLHRSLVKGHEEAPSAASRQRDTLRELELYKHRQLFFASRFPGHQRPMHSEGELMFMSHEGATSFLNDFTSAVNGRPTAVYLQLGAASRVAFAIGLHKDIDYQSPGEDREKRLEANRTTFWCLAFWECWTTFVSGRPSSVHMGETSCLYPTHQIFVQMLGRLGMTISKAKASMYGPNQLSALGLWRAAQGLHAGCLEFADETRKALGFSIDGKIASHVVDIRQVYLTNFYQHTVMLIFKPFLIIHALLQSPSATSFVQQHKHKSPQEAPSSEITWLTEACTRAIDATSRLIIFLSESIDLNPVIKTQCYTAWHIEYACFMLFQDMVRDPTLTNARMLPINSAITYLSKFTSTKVVPGVTHTIVTLRDSILNLAQRSYSHPTNDAPEQEEFPVRQDALDTEKLQGHDLINTDLSDPFPHNGLHDPFVPDGLDFEQLLFQAGDYDIGFDPVPADWRIDLGWDADLAFTEQLEHVNGWGSSCRDQEYQYLCAYLQLLAGLS